MNYYYLAASLIPIEFGDIPGLTFLDLIEKYRLNLTQGDMKQLETIRLFFDLENIKQLYTSRGSPASLDSRGNLSKKELKQALEDKNFFPEYVYDFLKQHEANKDIVVHFSSLISAYFTQEARKASGFLRQYLEFERNWRLILTGFRAKKLKRNLYKEFAFEEISDPVVSLIIAQKDSPYFETPVGYEELNEMLLVVKDRPMYQYRYLAEFRFRKVREMAMHKPFTIDYLLAYAVRTTILEDLHALDEVKGQEILNSIVKD
jgi:hypothetical protein